MKANLKFVLLVIVTAIWGRVFYAWNDAAVLKEPSPTTVDQGRKELNWTMPAKYDVKLNYRDPFHTHESTTKSTVQKDIEPSRQHAKWPKVVYKGVIYSPSNESTSVLVSVDGNIVAFNEDEEQFGVKVLSAEKDSVFLQWEGSVKVFIR